MIFSFYSQIRVYKGHMKTRISHLFLTAGLAMGLVLATAQSAAAKAQMRRIPFVDAPALVTQGQHISEHSSTGSALSILYAGNEQHRISPSQAKSAAMRRVRGAKFVNVQLVGQNTYRVRLQQKNGRIIDVYVDAYTGQVKN